MKNSSIRMNLKKMVRVISVINRTSPRYLRCVIGKSILESILPFVNIIFSYLILDALIAHESSDLVLTYVGWLIGLNFVLGLFLHIIKHFIQKYNVWLRYNLTNLIALKNFELDYEQVEDSETMKMIQKAEEGSNSSGGLESYCENAFGKVLNAILQIIYAIILLTGLLKIQPTDSTMLIVKIINHPASALIILIMLALSSIGSTIILSKLNKLAYQAFLGNVDGNRRYGYLYRICSDYRYGKDIRIYSMQDMIIDIMSDKKFSVDNNWRSYSLHDIRFNIRLNILNKLLIIVAYAYVGIKAIYHLISIGNVVSYVSAITILGTAIKDFLSSYVLMSHYNTYLDNYFDYLNLSTKMIYGTREFTDETIEIEFKNVSFSYPKQTEKILNNINLTIKNGQKLAIVGQNGAGKTTLIKLLCRLYEPTEGCIYINGHDIKEYSKDALYSLFSVVFQDFKIFSYSIKDNVSAGNAKDDAKVWETLEKAGIKERVIKMEDGLDTILYQRNNESGVEISGGEAQKIAIARALYKNAPIVILDEPTSALDPISEAEIYEKFNQMVENKTSIFISHRMSSCKFCDEIIVIENGKIIQKGNHQTLLNDQQGLYHQLWSAQAKYYINSKRVA